MKFLFFVGLLFSISALAQEDAKFDVELDEIISAKGDGNCMKSIVEVDGLDLSSRGEVRIVGLYFIEEDICKIVNIMPLEKISERLSAHEVLETIFAFLKDDGYLLEYEVILNGRVFLLKENITYSSELES
jgi:hypothetical protein